MLTYWEILTAIKSNVPVNDSYAKLWGRKSQGGYTLSTYTGTLPATLTGTKAGYLHGYKIYGNTEQDGTPTPENPNVPSECGELETTGIHAGQYKLPLTSAGRGVDIYLGEQTTTRRIKKLVLTGEETITGMTDANDGAKAVSYTYSSLGMTDIINNERYMETIPYPIFLSSHFKEKTSGYSSWFNINAGEIGANNALPYAINRYLIFGTSEQTQADFKAYLAQQYANGTPVTVWYILATEETGTINEPLRKIGNYADTIDSTQTTAQIPTSAGSTSISWAGQGLAPSQVELEYEKKR